MVKFIFQPWFVGIFVVVIVRIIIGQIFDLTPICSDGWRSPSIGLRGVCSYHGGVDRGAVALANISSLLLGIATYIAVNVIRENVSTSEFSGSKKSHSNTAIATPAERSTNKIAQIFLAQHLSIVDAKLVDLAKLNCVELFGDCINCGTRFRWHGAKITNELRDYQQYSINEIRGKHKCPDCGEALQFGYNELD